MQLKIDLNDTVYFIDNYYCTPIINVGKVIGINITSDPDEPIVYTVENFESERSIKRKFYEFQISTSKEEFKNQLIQEEQLRHKERIEEIERL